MKEEREGKVGRKNKRKKIHHKGTACSFGRRSEPSTAAHTSDGLQR